MKMPTIFSPESPPAPCPPLEARPYALYARHILKLHPLDPLDQEPSASLLGLLIHQACEQFISEGGEKGLESLLEKKAHIF